MPVSYLVVPQDSVVQSSVTVGRLTAYLLTNRAQIYLEIYLEIESLKRLGIEALNWL